MKIALCQMANAGSMAANLEKSLWAIETAAGNGAAESIRIGSQRIELMKQYGILKK